MSHKVQGDGQPSVHVGLHPPGCVGSRGRVQASDVGLEDTHDLVRWLGPELPAAIGLVAPHVDRVRGQQTRQAAVVPDPQTPGLAAVAVLVERGPDRDVEVLGLLLGAGLVVGRFPGEVQEPLVLLALVVSVQAGADEHGQDSDAAEADQQILQLLISLF